MKVQGKIMKYFKIVFVVFLSNQIYSQKIYSVDYPNQANGKEGKWLFTDFANQAKKKIYFVQYENQANLKIHFVKYANQAAWYKTKKKDLMY